MPSRNQRKGYETNAIARQFLLSHGYTWVWFKSHQRHQDTVYIDKSGAKLACTDIFGLFDGIAFYKFHPKILVPVYLQIKTNSWKGWHDIKDFCEDKAIKALFINVRHGKVECRYT